MQRSWFVGASYDRTNDQTPRFLADGIWENGYDDRYLDQVKSMRPGQRIAIKSTYTQKHNLPFDAKGQPVSVMVRIPRDGGHDSMLMADSVPA